MSIDYKKVLENKKSPIQKRFEILRENYNIQNSAKYLEFVRSQSPETILENTQYVYSEPRSGADFILTVMKANDLSVDKLQGQKASLESFLAKCTANKYSNMEHLKSLNECLQFIDNEIARKNNIQYIKEDMKYQLNLDFLPKALMESGVTDDLDDIIQNVNYHPEVAGTYETFVKNIRNAKATVTITNFPAILAKNTALVVGITVTIAGTIVSLIVSLPVLLAAKMIAGKVNKKYINSYSAVIDKEVKSVDTALASADKSKVKMLQDYRASLLQAKKELVDYSVKQQKPVKVKKVKSTKIVAKKKKAGAVKEAYSVNPMTKTGSNFGTKLGYNMVTAMPKMMDKVFGTTYEVRSLLAMRRNLIKNKKYYQKLLKESQKKENKESVKYNTKMIALYGIAYEDLFKASIDSCDTNMKRVEMRLQQLKREGKVVKEGITEMEPSVVKPQKDDGKIYREYTPTEEDIYDIDDDDDRVDIADDEYGLFLEALDEYESDDDEYCNDEDDNDEDKDDETSEDDDYCDDDDEPATESSETTDDDESDDDIVDDDFGLDNDDNDDKDSDDINNIDSEDAFDDDLDEIDTGDDYDYSNCDDDIDSDYDDDPDAEPIDINDADPDPDEMELLFAIQFVDTFVDDENEDINLESFIELIRIGNMYNRVIAQEGITDAVVHGAKKMEDNVRKGVHSLRHQAEKGKMITTAIGKIPESLENIISNTISDLKKKNKEERRNSIIEGGFKFKLFKFIRGALEFGITAALAGPVIAAIGLLVAVAIDKSADEKERRAILHELETELQIVNEKIEDARGDANKQNKYQLIRIKNKLEDDVTRVKYRLDK